MQVWTDVARESGYVFSAYYNLGRDRAIMNRIRWMSGGQMARWKDDQITDTFPQKACQFIEQNKNCPFFRYFATHIAHSGGTKGPVAIPQGDWKLIQAGGARESYADANKTYLANKRAKNRPAPFLVNLANDRGETKSLAAEHPDKVAQLRTLFQELRDAGRSRPK
jgi:hypothetical protein